MTRHGKAKATGRSWLQQLWARPGLQRQGLRVWFRPSLNGAISCFLTVPFLRARLNPSTRPRTCSTWNSSNIFQKTLQKNPALDVVRGDDQTRNPVPGRSTHTKKKIRKTPSIYPLYNKTLKEFFCSFLSWKRSNDMTVNTHRAIACLENSI